MNRPVQLAFTPLQVRTEFGQVFCYEFCVFPLTPRSFGDPERGAGWRFLNAMLESSAAALLLPTTQHERILNEVIAELPHLRGNILHDVHTAVLMREHGIREIYTRDADFSRFPFLRVLDPVA